MEKLAETVNQTVKVMHDREGKYLTFILAGQEYGIANLKIKEIIGIMPITTVPQTPDTGYIPGMARMEGGVKILLDIDRVLNAEEVAGPAKPA